MSHDIGTDSDTDYFALACAIARAGACTLQAYTCHMCDAPLEEDGEALCYECRAELARERDEQRAEESRRIEWERENPRGPHER